MKRQSQRGVALVVTLIMLSVITLLTVAFLAISRRNKEAVGTSMTQVDAKAMSDAALARAQGEVIAKMMSTLYVTPNSTNVGTNLLNLDLMVSRTYVNTNGYDNAKVAEDPSNVNFDHYTTGVSPLIVDDWVRNIGNLSRDPRVPVFVKTRFNTLDFRFYHDLNRNGRYDTNGLTPVRNPNGGFYDTNGNETVSFVPGNILMMDALGDPEWIGILERPDFPHSGTNRFIGRYSYVVLPTGKSLDLNFIHNQAKLKAINQDGYLRNQGYGSWEINLAAFLADLNTNYWNTNVPALSYNYVYNTNDAVQPAISSGLSFDDARELLRYRYSTTGSSANGTYNNLATAQGYFFPSVPPFAADGIDNYADGSLMLSNTLNETAFVDAINLPWSGSDNTNNYFTLFDELYDSNKIAAVTDPIGFVGRLIQAGTQTNSYDRYTFYRLLSQLGTDSAPESSGKININYKDQRSFVRWTNNPVEFFTNAAMRMMSAHYGTPVTNINIQIYGSGLLVPTNYPLEIHRFLQLAANIYDATTSNAYPTVFRPIFNRVTTGTNVNVYIVNYVEQTDTNVWTNPWKSVDDVTLAANDNVFGIPLIIGAKKFWTTKGGQNFQIGYPSFNEFAVYTLAQVTRRLEIVKPGNESTPSSQWKTNQQYVLAVTNVAAVESWNSYVNPAPLNSFPYPLDLVISNQTYMSIRDQSGNILYTGVTGGGITNSSLHIDPTAVDQWWGTAQSILRPYNLRVTLTNLYPFMRASLYSHSGNNFGNTSAGSFESASDPYYVPCWTLLVTNRMQYMLVLSNRVVDFVNTGDLVVTNNLAEELQALPNATPDMQTMWNTNYANSPLLPGPIGLNQQLLVSLYSDPQSGRYVNYWPNNERYYPGNSWTGAVTGFRAFWNGVGGGTGLTNKQAPFSPTWNLLHTNAWRVNDPFVHHVVRGQASDVNRTPIGAGTILNSQLVKDTNFWVFIQKNSNLGQVNEEYEPWGGNPGGSTAPETAYDFAFKDPLVKKSDDWDFPMGVFPSIGWLGRVHRGTPWQTVYLKSEAADAGKWDKWAHNVMTHPTNDWKLIDMFTTAPNDNASRGLLSVNQTNLAAWSAVLSGVLVLSNSVDDAVLDSPNGRPGFTPIDIKPSSVELSNIWAAIVATNKAINGFAHLGDVLLVRQLTTNSPFLTTSADTATQTVADQTRKGITDAAYERIPQQILSLLKLGEPRFVIYAWGQALKPADNSIVFNPPTGRPELQNLCTNYQVTGEVATRAVVRIEPRVDNGKTNYQAIIESYNILPGN